MDDVFFIVFISHRPASTSFDVEYIYPKWGLESVTKEWKKSLNLVNLGKAHRIIIPPIEWPKKQTYGIF